MPQDIRNFPLVRLAYKIPGLVWLYHFLWAVIGALIYRFPGKRIFVVGVTGTKGKTTTLELLGAILEAAGKKTAVLSSLREKIAEHSRKNGYGNTMPGRARIQRFLSRAVRFGCKYALIEVTSEGVKMNRHKFINWNAGVLTGLHPEHVESHGSFEKYRKAKLSFLKYVLRKRGKVFINKNDENAGFFIEHLDHDLSSRATQGRGNLTPTGVILSETKDPRGLMYVLLGSLAKLGMTLRSQIASSRPGWTRNDKSGNVIVYSKSDKEITAAFPTDLPLRGAIDEKNFVHSDFNKDNMAAAVAVALELGVGIKTIEEALREFRGVPGRMEFIRRGGITAVVDYAHTPDSLRAVYKYLRALMADGGLRVVGENHRPSAIRHKLICVLGSAGGGRDKWKRPEMGKVAAEYCDEIILTEDDSYDEKPETIIKEILEGIRVYQRSNPRKSAVYEIVDRREAIFKAIELAHEDDTVVCAGFGSQDFMRKNGKKIPWNERAVVEGALKNKHN